jgi:PRTRC genetic system protein C
MVTDGTPIITPNAPPKTRKRFFVIDGREFADPNEKLTVEEVRQHYVDFFPELANAETTTVKRGEDDVISFTKRTGTKSTGKPLVRITVLKSKKAFLFTDSDLWGLDCALQHAIQDGYAKENLSWYKDMSAMICTMRGL